MQLVHRKLRPEDGLDEADCYEHACRDPLARHVSLVPPAPRTPPPEVEWDPAPSRHVTTDGLKRQFEERLDARKRRSRR